MEYVPSGTAGTAPQIRRPATAPPPASRAGSAVSAASSTDGATAAFSKLTDGTSLVPAGGVAAAAPSAATKKPRRVGLAVNVTGDSKLPVLVESVAGEGSAL